MISIKIILTCLTLIITPIIAVEIELSLGFTNLFVSAITTNTIFFNDRSIKNSTMVFAGCNEYHNNKILSCVIRLVYPTSEVTANLLKCNTNYYYRDEHTVDRLLTLEPLYDNRVLFMWLVVNGKDYFKDPYVIMRVINMEDCEYKDNKVPLGERPHFHGPNFAVYNDTLDLFYRDESLCGDMMCGETYDIDGEIINGPVASYIKADYFKKTVLMCPVKQGSSALGHFLITSKVLLVSSLSGKAKELMDFPTDVVHFTYSCSHGFLGICWLEALNDTYMNCRQFDSQGNQVLNTKAELSYSLGSTMSMKNLADGGVLLQTNECKADEDWCKANWNNLMFYAHRIERDGTVKKVADTTNVPCNAEPVIGIDVMTNKDICLTFGCLSDTLVPQTNVEVRTIFYCVGLRNITAMVPKITDVSTEAPVEQYKISTKKSVKPTKKKGSLWHV